MESLPQKQADGLETIEAIRAFNRFYTRQLGLIGQAFLDSRFTLTEARIIYELANRQNPAAKALADDLHLNPAYLSRILKKFRQEKLLETRPDPDDARCQILNLTTSGRNIAEDLANRSRVQISQQIAALTSGERDRLATAVQQVQQLLEPEVNGKPDVVIRPHRIGDVAFVVHRQAVLYAEEYGWNGEYEALAASIGGAFLKDFKPGREFCWIAEHGGEIAGSVFLVEAGSETAKLRLLYVEPAARGLGVGKALVRACITFAREAGYAHLELWTNDVLSAARAIYQKQGFRLVSQEKHHSFGKDLTGQTWILDL
ncbi:bifunctional helix-turn-helix transcriptional regulator/GNAT family N-acetyltransferase [Pararhizobium sp.]|uniref:bifunctional helix-turn-helix transcriptional regulator/GNAT family N-acetyltransferase n=1 Tax=Pararhizobium sp. TaxID=1977563 RepID=UPI00271812D4|nr:helix-turn-helix domain-containing GNAT family N-acetyltransferase [Pararhizobium sp.]MDO9418765.1 helix-turn-helix domain-containing GNAT family N-acetyltransferase [Pararhizobium sp.]